MVRGCNSIFDKVGNPEWEEELYPLKANCAQLQQSCRAHFPDYLQDMLNDIKLVDRIQETSGLESRECILVLRRLANQRRHDCFSYYREHKPPAVMLEVNSSGSSCPQSVFIMRFPNKIPADMLE
jgi:hypothetical protein